jgi:N-methylhydantoinase B
MFEIHDPHFLIKHEYMIDSAGAGKWRGGLGVETEFRIDGTNVIGIAFGDGIEQGAEAFGLFGGKEGPLNKIELRYPDGTVRTVKSKEIIRDIPKGTIFYQQAGGGGGYGNPYERPTQKVLEDVINGVISIKKARDDYGVVINPKKMAVDEVRTEKLRKAQNQEKGGEETNNKERESISG